LLELGQQAQVDSSSFDTLIGPGDSSSLPNLIGPERLGIERALETLFGATVSHQRFPLAAALHKKIALPAPAWQFATQSANRGGLRMNVNWHLLAAIQSE
jgi:hypothetical protein